MSKRIGIIVNGSRKLNSHAQITIDLLKKEYGDACQLFKTSSPLHAIQLAKEATEDEFTHIIAVGGDGTANEVINGLQLSKRSREVVFGLIPNGTGNDFLKSLGSFQPKRFVEALKTNSTRQIDLILAKSKNKSSYAINIAGSGFDGYVVRTLHNMRKSFFKGKFAYILSILRSFISFKKPEVEITSEDFNYKGKMLLCTACNGTTFGYGLTINPDAKIDDGLISVALFGNVSLFDYLRNLGKLKRGEKVIHPEVHYHTTRKLTITTSNETFTEIDGEAFDGGSTELSIQKGILTIIS